MYWFLNIFLCQAYYCYRLILASHSRKDWMTKLSIRHRSWKWSLWQAGHILSENLLLFSEMMSEAVKLLKGEYCVRAIREHKMDKAIIFCRTKLDCDNMENYLNYHGGGESNTDFSQLWKRNTNSNTAHFNGACYPKIPTVLYHRPNAFLLRIDFNFYSKSMIKSTSVLHIIALSSVGLLRIRTVPLTASGTVSGISAISLVPFIRFHLMMEIYLA